MSLLDKFLSAKAISEQLGGTQLDPTRLVIERMISPTEGVINGRRTILAGTNNYLGLTLDPACVTAGIRAIEELGTGTTGSRMANGSFSTHEALEKELADFFEMPYAMVFSTGYSANLGTLTALLKSGDTALLDADAHASLHDGCQMSGANVYRFRHNDPLSLEKRLQRLGDKVRDCLIVVEGMYSVLGDTAPLAEIVELKNRYAALLLVDEAHSLGVYGDRGCGVAEAQGVLQDVDFLVGTFSKSLGAMGGFCVSPHPQMGLFRYVSRPFIFTASSSPSIIASTHEALRQLIARPELREALWRNAQQLYEGLKSAGFQVGPELSPVVAVKLGEKEQALAFWNQLLEAGIYTNLMIPPASPDRFGYIRCSVSAAHTAEQVQSIIDAFHRKAPLR